MKIDKNILVGLTGGIGSGKSTVSKMFADLGAELIDFDLLAKEVVRPGQPALEEIVKHFGKTVLQENGELNRKKLGAQVFASKKKRQMLEKIVHPRIEQEFVLKFENILSKNPCATIIADVPLLIEANLHDFFQKIILVYAPREVQLQRVINRDGLSQEEALARISAQLPMKEKKKYANYLINNQGDLDATRKQVLRVWQALQALKRS